MFQAAALFVAVLVGVVTCLFRGSWARFVAGMALIELLARIKVKTRRVRRVRKPHGGGWSVVDMFTEVKNHLV